MVRGPRQKLTEAQIEADREFLERVRAGESSVAPETGAEETDGRPESVEPADDSAGSGERPAGSDVSADPAVLTPPPGLDPGLMTGPSLTKAGSSPGRPAAPNTPPWGVSAPWGIAQAPVATDPGPAAPSRSGYPAGALTGAGLLLGPGGSASSHDLVTCPECGEMASVDSARRLAEDFCRKCDFPLFWARTTVVLGSEHETGASLRRLPGTVGRASTASVACPHCGEPNSPLAQTCVRCALSMHPAPPPPPPPVYVPEPEPIPVLQPLEREYPLWWMILVGVTVLVLVLILVWIIVGR